VKTESFPPAANIGLFIERHCQEHGVILRALVEAPTIAPPLTVEEAEIHEILRVVAVALDETLAHVRSEGLM
jgi:adenosylmethionine-8-amino-7-oxononanoate aminotransferase